MLIEVSEQSQAGNARRQAVAFAERLDLGETRCGEIAIATTEIATNLLKHAGKGHILVQQLARNKSVGLRIMGVDKGPGIADVALALEDGHSTADSLGTGLGAIKRLSDTFEVYTAPGAGTIVDAVFWQGKRQTPAALPSIEVACVSEPIRGEEINGDGWAIRRADDAILLLVVDGLGHGFFAAEAAREAERMMADTTHAAPDEIIAEIHLALKKTRGAAAAIAKVDPAKGLLCYAGVGNISAVVANPETSRSLASHNGTLGQQMERLQQFACPWTAESVLVMHSDGLGGRWDLRRYPGIWRKPPSVVAAVLHRDFCRERDDVTVLVAKGAQPGKREL
jgi:anti-sigma regulatory factor (Ser/Thr protein kinase)